MQGTQGAIHFGLAGLAVFDLELVRAVVDAGKARLGLAEKSREPLKISLLPGGERVVVALGAIQPDAEEGPGNPARQLFRVRPLPLGVFLVSDRDEVGRRLVGPEAVLGNQPPHQPAVGIVLHQLVASQAVKRWRRKKMRPILGPDVSRASRSAQ